MVEGGVGCLRGVLAEVGLMKMASSVSSSIIGCLFMFQQGLEVTVTFGGD